MILKNGVYFVRIISTTFLINIKKDIHVTLRETQMKNINHKQKNVNHFYFFDVIYFSCFFCSKNYYVDHLYNRFMHSKNKKKMILEMLFHVLNENFSVLSPAIKSGYVGAYGERWKIL